MTAKNLFEKIPEILLAQLTSFCLVYGLTSSLCLTYPPIKIILLVMLCITILFAFFYNKKTTIASTILLGTVLAAGIMYIAFGTVMDKVIAFLSDYFYWLGDFIQYPGIPDPLYQFITVMVLSILLSVFSYVFILKKFMFLVILAAGMGIFTIQWSYNIVTTLMPFYLFLLVTLIIYLKYIYIKKASREANEYARPSLMVIWSLPICIMIAALAFSIDASDKPIEWKWLDKKIVSVYNAIVKKVDYEVFDYFSLSASSGFGEKNNLLGGRVRLDRTNVLNVTSDKNVYLKGATKEVYTGTAWLNSSHLETPIGSDFSALYNETNEMLFGMKILSGNDDIIEDYFYTNKASVTFMNLKTKSLFIPSKMSAFTPKENSFTYFVNNMDDLSSDKRLTKGFNYTMEMYIPKIGTEDFANVMRKSKKGLYFDYIRNIYISAPLLTSQLNASTKTNEQTKIDISIVDIIPIKGATSTDQIIHKLVAFLERINQIYNDYLQLPQNLPQRVKDLSASLVASCQNDYDKAKAIEQYLSSNYPYNLDVRSTPRNRDFVDYFLFDLKEGYCSYYASAMTVLARCAGLPARYVEGYMLPPEPIKDNSTTYLVTNMQAHAWVEIYFEGYGWLPFEPTAPFSSTFYLNETESDPVFASDYDSSFDDYMEMMRKYGNEEDSDIASDEYVIEENTSSLFIMLIIAGILIFLFTALLMFNIIRSRLKLYKLINLPAKESILNLYKYYISVLGLQGFGYKTAETPFQYSDRIDSFMYFSPVKFKAITNIFVKCRYSLIEATDNEKQLLCDFHSGFLEEIKVNMGRFRYFIFKYILGKF